MYILECADGSYYTGSTNNLDLRLAQHQAGEGANHTKKHLPVKLVYFEEYERIDQAFNREKQVQGWSRKKKEALINDMPQKLHELSECMNETHCKNYNADIERNTNNKAETERNTNNKAETERNTNNKAETERSRSSANGGFGYAQPPENETTQLPEPARCLSVVEGSTLQKQAEGREISGLKAYE